MHTPIHKDEDAKEMSDFETCRQACAAQNECCNNDVSQGSNQKLSCLQACMVVRSGVSKDECLDHCPVKACSREINGMEFNSCSVCDDVPAHKDAFGDDFKPVSYKCAARFGTNSQSCEAGCNAGAEGANAKASEHKHKRKHKRKPTPEPMDDSKYDSMPMPVPGPEEAEDFAEFVETLDDSAMAPTPEPMDDSKYDSVPMPVPGPEEAEDFAEFVETLDDSAMAPTPEPMDDSKYDSVPMPVPGPEEAEDLAEFVETLDDSAMAPTGSDEMVEELMSQVDLPLEQKEGLEETYEQLFASNFAECQSVCAAQNECCNNDVSQGSNRKLSCLQACMVVRSGASKDECMEQCPVDACSREINGVTYESCQVCDDVFEHKDAFGDDFKPVSYKCSAKYGTNQASCEKGCAAGAASYDDYVETPAEIPGAAPAPDFICADENDRCACGEGVVVYGDQDSELEDVVASGSYFAKWNPGFVICDNDSMGGDPAPGHGKRCWCAPEWMVPEESQPEAAAASEPTPEPEPDFTPEPTPERTPEPESESQLGDFEMCQYLCAAKNECCNNDVSQGSNQKLSCLQACMVVRSGVSKDECRNNCGTSECTREINGVTYESCQVCDDVPEHKDAFGDVFVGAPYECSAKYGTNEDSCLTGCEAGEMTLGPKTTEQVLENAPSPEEAVKEEERDEITDTHMATCDWYCTSEATMYGEMDEDFYQYCFSDCMTVINMCIDKCASHNECCNNDFMQGSNRKPSCLQACVARFDTWSEKECLETCPTDTCTREFHGITFDSCGTCDDVPAHKESFGDEFKPQSYECSAMYGTNEDSCEQGCKAGQEILEAHGEHEYDYMYNGELEEPEKAAANLGRAPGGRKSLGPRRASVSVKRERAAMKQGKRLFGFKARRE